LGVALLIGGVALPAQGQRDPRSEEAKPSPEEYERSLKKRMQDNPKDWDAAYALAKHFYDQGDRAQAEKGFRRVLEIKPDHVPSVVNLGIVLNEAGKSEDALKEFDRALALKPGDTAILCHKGQALYALKRREEAVKLYLEAIDADPSSQLAHYWLGIAFADASIYREAIVEWQRVIEIDPESEIGRAAAEGVEVLRPLIGAVD